MNAKHVLFVCPIFLALACNQKKQFGGAVDAKNIPEKKAAEVEKETETIPQGPEPEKETTEVPTTETEVPTIPKCDVGESEVTKVNLLTTGVDFSLENQVVKYELQILSCKDGTIVPLNDQSIAFDLNMHYYNGDLAPIGYRVLEASSSTELVSGDFKTVSGSDLFGNTGSGYRHWSTENVSFASKVEKIVLEINLKKAKLKTINAGDKTADSYLRMGKASAVTASINVIGQ